MNDEASPTVSERKGYLGGSDAAAVLDLSPYQSRFSLFMQKVTTEPLIKPVDAALAERFEFGHLLEEPIAQAAAQRLRVQIVRGDAFYRHPHYSFLGGHVDFLIPVYPALLECKNIRYLDADWGNPKERVNEEDDQARLVPPYYAAQVDHYLLVLDYEFAYLAALFGGSELRVYRINRDKNREQILLEAECRFWERVQNDDPPDPTGADEIETALRTGYLQATRRLGKKKIIVSDPELLAPMQAYAHASNALRRAKLDTKNARGRLIELLHGELGNFCDPEGNTLVNVVVQNRRAFQSLIFKAEHPEEYERYCTTSPSLVLRAGRIEDSDDDEDDGEEAP